MRKIKIAQIGTSRFSHGNDIFRTLTSLPELFEIVGYALPENEREKFPERMAILEPYREMTVEEILSDPEIEAVTIETEEIYLTKYATLAAKSGKQIHCEKPGGREYEDFKNLIEVAKDKKIVLHFGYMYRYNPYINSLLKRIKDGELGEIICVEAQMNCMHPASAREWMSTFKGGMMFFLGCHLLDLILQIQGEPLKITPLNKVSGVGGTSSEDFGMAVLEYQNGVSFAKASAVEKGGLARRQIVVSGTKGTVEIRPIEGVETYPLLQTGYREVYGDAWGADAPFNRTDGADRYIAMMSEFAKMVRGEKQNPYTYDYELTLYKTVLKACGVDIKQ